MTLADLRLTLRRSTAAAGMLLAMLLAFSSASAVRAQEDDRSGEAIALFNKGQDAHEKGDLAGAVKLYEEALVILPEFPEAELQRGNAFISLDRIEDAEKAFRHAVELRGDWSIALASLGSVLVREKKFGDAEPILAKAVDLDEQNFPALVALAELRLKTEASPAVLAALLEKIRPLTEKARPPASLWAARAALERAMGSRLSAKESLANALQLDPKNRSALFESAQLALAENDPAAADSYAKRIEALWPGAEDAKLLRARILLAQGRIDDGAKVLETIRSPDTEVAKLQAVVAALRSTDTDELEKQLDKAPKNAAILGRLCSSLRLKDPERAVEYCRRAFEADNGNIGYAIGFGAALVQAKRYGDAASVLTKIVAADPDNATAHANLATALFQLKKYPEAKAEYLWLVDKQPNLAAAYYFLAITHDELGEYLDAMANYQQFLRLADPVASKLEIDKVNLRLPTLQKQIKERKGRKNG